MVMEFVVKKESLKKGWQEKNLPSHRKKVLSTKQLQNGLWAGIIGEP